MKRISARSTFFLRMSPLLILVLGNALFLSELNAPNTKMDSAAYTKAIVSIESVLVFVSLLFSWFPRKFWHVEADGQHVKAKKWKTQIEFLISDINSIEVIPNLLDKGRDFYIIITLKHNVGGYSEFIYKPVFDNVDDAFLIIPWQKSRIDKAQVSLKRRKARR